MDWAAAVQARARVRKRTRMRVRTILPSDAGMPDLVLRLPEDRGVTNPLSGLIYLWSGFEDMLAIDVWPRI